MSYLTNRLEISLSCIIFTASTRVKVGGAVIIFSVIISSTRNAPKE